VTPLPTLDVEDLGSVIVIALRGDLDLANLPEFDRALRAAMPNGPRALVLDLDGAGFLDSSAVQVLFTLHRDLQQRRQAFALVLDAEAPTRRALELSDPSGVLTVHATRDAALAAAA